MAKSPITSYNLSALGQINWLLPAGEGWWVIVLLRGRTSLFVLTLECIPAVLAFLDGVIGRKSQDY